MNNNQNVYTNPTIPQAEPFEILVDGQKPFTNITKNSISDVAGSCICV